MAPGPEATAWDEVDPGAGKSPEGDLRPEPALETDDSAAAALVEAVEQRAAAAELARRLECWAFFSVEEVLEALELDDARAGLLAALDRAVSNAPDPCDDSLLATLTALRAELSGAGEREPGDAAGGVVFDVSDLIAHVRRHRTFTGIQRVQAEVALNALRSGPSNVRAAASISGRDTLVELPREVIERLMAAADAPGASGVQKWRVALAGVATRLLTATPLVFRRGDVLVNVGSSWWQPDYLRFVREAQILQGIAYLPVVHDLVPWFLPEFCGSSTIREFRQWLSGALEIADGFLAISASTATDLARAAAALGRPLAPDRVRTVALDGQSNLPAPLDIAAELDRLGLGGEAFVLLVSTLEPRKNHVLAFKAWGDLVRARGADAIPLLVCAGRTGWRSEPIFDALRADPKARARVRLLDRVTDADLEVLYRACLFTLFPSRYEGWGLPVSESLAHGKTPVVSTAASLPEVAGPFGVYFDPGSVTALVRAVTVMLDPFERSLRDAAIRARYRPRRWSEVADEVLAAADRVRPQSLSRRERPVEPGVWHDLTAPRGAVSPERVWRDHRIGPDWRAPDARGSATAARGGRLRLPVVDAAPQRLFLRVAGLRTAPSQFAVYVDGEKAFTGSVEAEGWRWVLLDVAASPPARTVDLCIRGYETEEVDPQGAADTEPLAGVSLAGYMLCPRQDERMRTEFLEFAALGDLTATPSRRLDAA